jgi:hypothetical protein
MFTLRTRPPDFFAKHVKTLLCYNAEDSQYLELFSACTGVVNLAFWGHVDCTWLRSIKAPENIRRLSIRLQPPPAPIFTNVTHLDVVGPWPTVEALRIFPNLTHLALDDDPRYINVDEGHLELLPSLLSSSNILKVVILLVHNLDMSFRETIPIYRHDFRLVLLDQPLDFESFVEAWEGTVCGGSNMWARAEEEADKRRRIMMSQDGRLH